MLIDTHTHLESFARKGEVAGVLERAKAAAVDAMITIGTDTEDWDLYRGLAEQFPGVVRYTVGLHPCSVGEDWVERVARIEAFWRGTALESRGPKASVGKQDMALESHATNSATPPVAVGETGLDKFHLPRDDAAAAERMFGWQREAFAAQMRIATRLGCPLVVHSRGAFRECVEMVDAAGFDWSKVVFHCFTEGADEMREITKRGGFGSFTGIITYKAADAVRAAALAQGLDRLMLETDAPYLTPMPHRGKPNEVSYIRHTADFCAQLFGVGGEKLGEVTSANARRFFGI